MGSREVRIGRRVARVRRACRGQASLDCWAEPPVRLGGHDLAVLHLPFAFTDVVPKTLTRFRMTQAAVGQIDHLFGYGETIADHPGSAGELHEAPVPITYVTVAYFGWRDMAPSYTCYGDSGGPQSSDGGRPGDGRGSHLLQWAGM